jgi:hypothetical protein
MRKILIGLVAVIAVAAAGFFGLRFYTQHRVASQIEAAFDQIRASGGKASHGKVSFDPWSRTVTIADIAGESATQPPLVVKIASVTATGVSEKDGTRFSADSIEVSDLEVSGGQAALQVSYVVPRAIVKDYSGPAGGWQLPASASILDLYRLGLEQFVEVTASSISAPTMAATMNFGAATPGGGTATYSGLAMEGIKDGRIATFKADGFAFTVNMLQAGKAGKMTGNMANIAAYDFDARAAAAILDPQKASDDRYYRVYRQITAGAYAVTSGQGPAMRIDGLTFDDFGVRPSRVQLPDLLAALPAAGAAAPTPAQVRELMEKGARLYEGIHIGNAEMRGLAMDGPDGAFKFAAIRLSMENGKANEIAFEGFDGDTPTGPLKVARIALKGFDFANLLRKSVQFASPAQKPVPEQVAGLIALLEGAEIKGFVAPYKNTGKPLNIDLVRLDWGQFVGPIPSKARLTAKVSGPLDANDPRQKMLVAAGLDRAAMNLDFGAAWTEASGAFVLEPVTFELGSLVKASARVALANVPRALFSLDPQQAAGMAMQIEAGTLDLTLRDIGGVDLAIAQYARAQNLSREAARQTIVDNIRAAGEHAITANPDAEVAVEAIARFVETSGQTLVIKLTPRGKVPAIQLVQVLQMDPLTALAQFRIEASTGL